MLILLLELDPCNVYFGLMLWTETRSSQFCVQTGVFRRTCILKFNVFQRNEPDNIYTV
jgi:hypothetical protein